MSLFLMRQLSTALAAESGYPVTVDPAQAARLLLNAKPGSAVILQTPSTEWETYTDGTMTVEAVIVTARRDDHMAAWAALDALFFKIVHGLNALGYGVDSQEPAAYKAIDRDTHTYPAYRLTFTIPFNIDDLTDQEG